MSDTRTNISSGTSWEEKFGYSRIVKKGPFVFIAGTVAANEEGQLVGGTDAGKQTEYIFEKIFKYLAKAEATPNDIIRIRIFTTDISQWEAIGAAHGKIFKDIKPAMSMIGVDAFVDDKFLVEIEADAVV